MSKEEGTVAAGSDGEADEQIACNPGTTTERESCTAVKGRSLHLWGATTRQQQRFQSQKDA